MLFALGVIVGILLSGIALYGTARLATPINKLFTVNPTSSSTRTTDAHKMAQVIKRELPVDKFLKDE